MDIKQQNQLLDDFGGTAAVANLCEITPGAVSQWRSKGIPRAQLRYLRLLRPDLVAEREKAQNITGDR